MSVPLMNAMLPGRPGGQAEHALPSRWRVCESSDRCAFRCSPLGFWEGRVCELGDDGIYRLLHRAGLGRRPGCLGPGFLKPGSDFLQLLAAEPGPNLREPLLLF